MSVATRVVDVARAVEDRWDVPRWVNVRTRAGV
jgi:hypothetical protein